MSSMSNPSFCGGPQLMDIGEGAGGVPVDQPLVELGGGDRSGYVVALSLVAAHAPQLGVGDLGLDAFGDHAQTQAVGQIDGGGDQGGGAGVVSHGENEGPVELEFVDG